MSERKTVEARKQQFLDAGVMLAKKDGLYNFTVEGVAKVVGCTHPLIYNYFESVVAFRDAVIRKAAQDGDNQILAQALLHGDKYAKKKYSLKERQTILLAAG